MSQEPGLRERKKQQTRELIAETARRLFIERGFDAVTVAAIARAADVSEATIFNYFPTKEDLFYHRREVFEEELLAAIRDREPGETILEAFGRFELTSRGILAMERAGDAREVTARIEAMARVITQSPALLAREQRVFADYTASLAAVVAAETGVSEDDLEPRVVANALFGVHRALIDEVRSRVLAGAQGPEIARAIRAQANRALARLATGLGDYGRKPYRSP